MKSIVLATALTAAFAAVSATPSVSDVTMTQANNKLVTITYKLDAPAIVTFDIVTNEVSIGTVNLTNAVGDVKGKAMGGYLDIRLGPYDHGSV
jgi:hypothetical protein